MWHKPISDSKQKQRPCIFLVGRAPPTLLGIESDNLYATLMTLNPSARALLRKLSDFSSHNDCETSAVEVIKRTGHGQRRAVTARENEIPSVVISLVNIQHLKWICFSKMYGSAKIHHQRMIQNHPEEIAIRQKRLQYLR